MVDAYEMILMARALASGGLGSGRGRPRQAELRRAVSLTYYAMFHSLAKQSADMLVGATRGRRSQRAWLQAYRALDHRLIASQCRRPIISRFPDEIRRFGKAFINSQQMRHNADYNPDASFARSEVLDLIDHTERVVLDFERSDVVDKRAFAVYVLFRNRAE